MIDSTILVDRLVAADDECKRIRLEVERLKMALEAAEKDASSLRGSCRSLGEDLVQARRSLTAVTRSLSWIMHNRSISTEGMPRWLLRSLKTILSREGK